MVKAGGMDDAVLTIVLERLEKDPLAHEAIKRRVLGACAAGCGRAGQIPQAGLSHQHAMAVLRHERRQN
jgi:hypothetical protein